MYRLHAGPRSGAIAHANAVPVFVDITQGLTVDLDDLRAKIEISSARVLLLSHMRGHVAAMDDIAGLCAANGITLIEDCAHTLGALWKGRKVEAGAIFPAFQPRRLSM